MRQSTRPHPRTIRNRPGQCARASVVFLACLLLSVRIPAIEYVFPAGANVVDITKTPYSADRTGKTDVSAILSKAVNDISLASGWGPGILYMPNGTYLVKNTFQWRIASNGNGIGPHVMGQSRTGTVIKLAKGTWPLGTEEKAVIQTGAGSENNFSKGIMNLTVLVDSNNAGAIGIIYVSNNNGLMSDVDVISADGRGMYGIQSAGGISGLTSNGPFIIRRTYIKGFDVGIRTCGSQSEMISQIRLEGQSKYGIWTSCILTIDSLTSNDTVQAIEAQGAVMLTHGLLLNGAPTRYAIRNWALGSYFNDITTTGYKAAITSAGPNPMPKGTSFDEYTPVVPVSLFPSPKTSMHLPTKYPPEIPWETDFAKWAFPQDYKVNGRTDAQALQAAIDDPARTTVCIARGRTYQIDQPVYVRGAIRRIIATGGMLHRTNSNGQLIIEDGSAPAVIIEKLSIDNVNGSPTPMIRVIKRTNRTVVLETGGSLDFTILGGGETYITDFTGGNSIVDNAQAQVWLWQWEGVNYFDSSLVIRNGIVRMAGYYHEGGGNSLFCLGGITEFLGYFDYGTECGSPPTGEYLLTVKNGANVSAAGVWQVSHCDPWAGYMQLVSETRNGTTKILGADSASGNAVSPAGGGNIALFTAYDSVAVRNALLTGVREAKPVAVNKDIRLSFARTHWGIEVTYSVLSPAPATLLAYDISGRIISVVKERSGYTGIHRTLIPSNGLSAGIVCVELRQGGQSRSTLAVPH
jgi:hypothetical protein